MDDLLVRGGLVADGTGRPPFRADVALAGGVITAVGERLDRPARRVLDAEGSVVCPGFVDTHTHDDLAVLRDPWHAPKLLQGVTCAVLGNCGHGGAPVGDDVELLASYSSPVLGPFPEAPSWRGFPEYLAVLADAPCAVNTLSLVPHGALRAAAMGYEPRPAGERETRDMAAVLDEALRCGAAGLSLGLMYAPGCYADHAELVHLARVVARHGGILACHLRSEGAAIHDSLDEAVRIARDSGVALHISHLKVISPANFGTMPRVLDRLDALRDSGLDVTADVYPYDAGSTTISGLFPPSTLDGGVAGLLKRLSDPAQRREVRQLLLRPWPGAENHLLAQGGHRIRICGFAQDGNLRFEGMSLADIATARGQDEVDCFLDLFVEENGRLTVIQFQMAESDVEAALTWPWSMIGSDGLPLTTGRLHPRHYGTFPRVLARYVRQRSVLSFESAIHKMTSAPAQRFGLARRGQVRAGWHADLCVISRDRIQDRATYDDPRRFPSGVDAVVVNGRLAAEAGRPLTTAGQHLAPGDT